MKKFHLALTSIFFTLIAILSCKSEANDPKSVAQVFTEAMINDEFDNAASYATKESKGTLAMLKTAKKMADMTGSKESTNMFNEAKGKTITYSDTKMDGAERAIISIMADGKEVIPLILKKEDGFWKVAFDIASIMDGERLNIKENSTLPTKAADSFITNLGKVNDSIDDAYNRAMQDLDTNK